MTTRHDSAEQADPAKRPRDDGDEVEIDDDGTVRQKSHGSMDATMIPQKPEPDRGPYEPAPGHLDDPKAIEPRGGADPAA
ncbi:hypothetical protein [Burkholderia plantarii]|uniref:hypothetical protein n=1 Tax=Burkholderia plantarii TaxID=41899 RepID=UPI0018DD0448|nr:hypothetical protein [Burkholderia plantarii]MBI0331796.1 hypothetical protein [Burkholderia plantarii]